MDHGFLDLCFPLTSVAPTLDAGVLQVLAATTVGCTAAEVHRRLGRGSDEGVRKVLARLVRQGVVLVETPARYPIYHLNREHIAVPHIEALTRVRGELFDRIREEVANWEVEPIHAGLFGSFARGTADSDSDIDVLLVRPVAWPTSKRPPGWSNLAAWTTRSERGPATPLRSSTSRRPHWARWLAKPIPWSTHGEPTISPCTVNASSTCFGGCDDSAPPWSCCRVFARRMPREAGASSSVLEVADLVLTEDRREAHVAAALAVLAGIAAADAICGFSLRKWSRGQDHTQAVKLLGEVALSDTTVPAKLQRLLADKDAAHYSPTLITVEKAKTWCARQPRC